MVKHIGVTRRSPGSAFLQALLLVVLTCGAWADDRHIALQGTRNTRELGGLPLASGRVRKGLVYRSGVLCFITGQDVERLRGLHLRSIIDLRSGREVARDGPDRFGLTTVVPNNHWWPMSNSQGVGQQAYYYLVRENPEVIRQTFALMARPDSYPVLFHCTAGKDRTGIISALLLELLGADRELIVDDYMQSVRNSAALLVKPDWIQEVFDAVDEAGGVRPYLKSVGVSEAELDQIRRLLIDSQGDSASR